MVKKSNTRAKLTKSLVFKAAIHSNKITVPNNKTSLAPIISSNTSILIAGCLPDDKSHALAEYYGDARNRFWKVISTITNHETSVNYKDKKTLLIKCKIGLWDLANNERSEGRLDSAIKNEEPNEIHKLITCYRNLKNIGFNGAKAEALFETERKI